MPFSSPSVTELLPLAEGINASPLDSRSKEVDSDDCPMPRKQRRLTFSRITGALGDIAEDAQDAQQPQNESCYEHEGCMSSAPLPLDTLPPPPQRRVRALPATVRSSLVASADFMSTLPPPPTRRVLEMAATPARSLAEVAASPARSLAEMAPDFCVAGREEVGGTQVQKRARESIGASARAEVMAATAAKTLAKQKQKLSCDESNSSNSTDEDEESFAYKVKHVASFTAGARAGELFAVSEGVEQPVAAVSSGDVSASALSRRAFASGQRAAEVAARVEAGIATRQTLMWSQPCSPVSASSRHASARSSVDSRQTIPDSPPRIRAQMPVTEPHQLQRARAAAQSLFSL